MYYFSINREIIEVKPLTIARYFKLFAWHIFEKTFIQTFKQTLPTSKIKNLCSKTPSTAFNILIWWGLVFHLCYFFKGKLDKRQKMNWKSRTATLATKRLKTEKLKLCSKIIFQSVDFSAFLLKNWLQKREKKNFSMVWRETYNIRVERRWRKIFEEYEKRCNDKIFHIRLTYNHWRIKRVLADWTENSRLLILQFVEFRDFSIRFKKYSYI